MIKNERQYRITRAQAGKFSQALSQLRVPTVESVDVHPLLVKAQDDALRSQLEDLQAQIAEYEALRSGQQKVLQVESFAELPQALIRARISAGMSQKQLAERLGLAEQQIQQYEASEYASASFTRIQEIIHALGILVREDVFLPSADVSSRRLFQRLQTVGIDHELVLNRLLPPALAAALRREERDGSGVGALALKAAAVVGRVFALTAADIFGDAPLQLNTGALATARFKLPAQMDERRVSAYTVYAHYLTLLALETTRSLDARPVPESPLQARRAILETQGALDFRAALNWVWSLGVPVLPLADRAGFHGACWRVGGRNAIVLAQQARVPARWLMDLLHETGHAAQSPEESERAVVETEDILESHIDSEDEEDARLYAEEIIFGGRSDEIAEKCVQRARFIEGLSRVVPEVARQEGAPADALAYFIAYRLTEEGKNWWGAATNLQQRGIDPWQIAREVLLVHADLSVLNECDRTLLLQALADSDE